MAKKKRRIVSRGPTKLKPITDDRKLISRKEAVRILGYSVDTIKKLEEHRGGPLRVIRLYPNARYVFYRKADVDALAEGITT